MALPSIEGGFASPTNQQAPHRIRTQQDDPFAFVDFANRLVPQNLVPSKVHQITYEEPPPGKKRRIDEQEYFETQNEESTILIPLDDRGGYHAMRQRPGGAGRDAQWPRLDSRIVPLPPRDAAGIQDPQGRVHNVSHHGQTEDRLIHRLPRAHFEVSLPSAEARGQPQSLLHSDAGQSGYFRQSPTVFNASESAQSYREVHNFRPILPHASGSVGSGGQVLANPQPVAERSQCFDDAGREMRNNLRNLAIDERQYRDCPGLQEDLMARCVIYARPQPASPKAYGIPRPRENMYSERPKDYTERARVDMLPQSGNMQYQPGNRQNGRGVQHFPLQVEQKPANPFERPLPQSGQMSDAQGWSDLQQPPSWLPPADPVSSRTYNAPPQGQPLYLQEESQIPSSDMRSGRMGNGRPIHQIYEGVRRLDRRAPEQVIVLND